MSYSVYFPQRLFTILRQNWDDMFYTHGEDGLSIEELSEGQPLLSNPPQEDPLHDTDRNSWKKYVHVQMKLPRVQTITGVLLGLLLLAMILMLVAEAIRESREPDPFLVQYATSPKPFTGLIHMQSNAFQQAWLEGESLVAYRKNLERMLVDNGILPTRGSASKVLQNFQKGNVDSQGLQDCAIIVEHMKKALGGCIDTSLLPDHCQPKKPHVCNETERYRTFNGSCNNLLHPEWGMAVTPFTRLLKAEYDDGVSSPKVTSVTGALLPNVRYLSNELYTHNSKPKSNHTILTIYFGLFVDHDIIRITSKTGHKGAAISCCHPQTIENPSMLHPECMAIGIPEKDAFFGSLGVRCMDFVRSAPAPGKCPGEREQINIVTSFLDASGLYGSFFESNHFLRSFKNGQMRVCMINDTEMLPQAHHISYQCGFPTRNQYCFRAGDMRANEQVELTAMHTIWLREHNRVAERLLSVNPHWDDERLFHESRRVVIAELQNIAYAEFLPVLLGREVMKQHDLLIDPVKGFSGYDPEKDPSIHNVFGAAAFRVGHSLIEATLDLIGPNYNSERQIPLHSAFLNPHIFYEKGIDLLLRGLVREKSQAVDTFITDEVRNRLFQPHTGKYGLDLAAIGIQRGRDHGLPGYTKWRKFCNLSEVNKWEDLFDIMDSAHVQRLRKVYESVEDIELEPAALSEYTLYGSMVGPTHACLIARQFHSIRYGDRFWFEAQNQAGSFTPGQLEQIYNSSMARILCDNSDQIKEIQIMAFKTAIFDNTVVSCSDYPDLPKVDLKVWSESKK